jgi:N-acetylglucosaminyldiphosphoundecaprenol N-acetyl-beta-D-mannosaminyltransferase
MKVNFEQVSILGVRVDVVSLDELLKYVFFIIQRRKKTVITYVNVHAINIAYEVGWFRDFINHSGIVFCDGFGVKWAARLFKRRELYRFTPPDWFGRLAKECAEQGFTMFFLGTQQAIVEKAAAVFRENYPGLQIVGVHHGFFNKNVTSSENQEIVFRINALKPDILVVGFGMPSQERWILENRDILDVHVIFPVGAFFDYIADEVVRAPRWMTENGLEWLGRLIIEPRRLWKRYIVGNPLFLWRFFIHDILGFPLRD